MGRYATKRGGAEGKALRDIAPAEWETYQEGGRRRTALHGVARRCTALYGHRTDVARGRGTGVARGAGRALLLEWLIILLVAVELPVAMGAPRNSGRGRKGACDCGRMANDADCGRDLSPAIERAGRPFSAPQCPLLPCDRSRRPRPTMSSCPSPSSAYATRPDCVIIRANRWGYGDSIGSAGSAVRAYAHI